MTRARTIVFSVVAVAALGAVAAYAKEEPKPKMKYPPTRVVDVKEVIHGLTVADPYRWLEDEKAPEVKSWMAAQDAFARAALAKLPGREALMKRLKQLYYVDSVYAPAHRGTRYFYRRTHADREKGVWYWREGENGKETVLLDPNTMSKDGTVSIGVVVPSWDGKFVAYSTKANNSDEATLHVMEVATGKDQPVDTIEGAKYAGPSWTPDASGFYYTWIPPLSKEVTVADRPGFAELRYHALGTDPAKDRVVHPATKNPQTFLGGGISRDGHWLFVYVQHGWNSTDVYFRDARGKDQTWKPLAVGIDAQFEVEAYQDRFYVKTNWKAPRWRVLVADPKKPAMEAWKEIVPQSPDGAVLDDVSIVGGQLALAWMKNAASQLELRTLEGKPVRTIGLPTVGTASNLFGLPEDDTAYFTFVSFTQPMQVWKTSVKTGEKSIWAEVKLPIDTTPYTVEQVKYPSKDGTMVSMFIVHRKDLKKDGSTPLILGGYGGFNVSITPSFQSGLYPWLEAGGAYATPNLRGGGEYGEEWHKAGMGAKKQNVFDDFIAAAEYLVKEGYTKPERLAIRGGSNGGLLVGAALTQRPDLFRAVICAVPLLDMVRYHLSGSGKTWIPEYGSAEDPAQAKTLYAYSPYHHVKPGTKYPAVLLMSADADDRVDPMHARKMAAALQAASTSGLPVLLRIEPHSGHGGADLVKQAVEQSADSYAFLMDILGLKGPIASAK
jgi:prolyl oligopeptidase